MFYGSISFSPQVEIFCRKLSVAPTPPPNLNSIPFDGFLCVHLLNPGKCIQLVFLCLSCKTMLNLPPKSRGSYQLAVTPLHFILRLLWALQCHCIKGALSVHESRHARILQPHYLGEVPFLGYLYPATPRAITFHWVIAPQTSCLSVLLLLAGKELLSEAFTQLYIRAIKLQIKI